VGSQRVRPPHQGTGRSSSDFRGPLGPGLEDRKNSVCPARTSAASWCTVAGIVLEASSDLSSSGVVEEVGPQHLVAALGGLARCDDVVGPSPHISIDRSERHTYIRMWNFQRLVDLMARDSRKALQLQGCVQPSAGRCNSRSGSTKFATRPVQEDPLQAGTPRSEEKPR